ncbi:hypothetical protein Jiend_14990 [Micromonospora endophytica]|nr:hypothetical protein Jiend_14990 [Micromonospora endophytica]
MVGVPEKTPPDDNAIPGGNDPDRTDNRYGAVPPEATKVCVGYGCPLYQGEVGSAEMTSTVGATTTTVTLCSADSSSASVSRMPKV